MKGNGEHGNNGHLARAILAMGRARTEFDRAKRLKDELDAGQAGEKAWLAVAGATKALLRLKGIPEHKMPEGYRGEFHMLRQHGGHELAKTYAYLGGVLHTQAFYRGVVVWDLTQDALGKADGFVSRVRQMAERRK